MKSLTIIGLPIDLDYFLFVPLMSLFFYKISELIIFRYEEYRFYKNTLIEVENVTSFEDNCCICMNKMKNPSRTKCNHVFCFGCIKDWVVKYNCNCPICRKDVKIIRNCMNLNGF